MRVAVLCLFASLPAATLAATAGGGRVDFLTTDFTDNSTSLRMEQHDLSGTTTQQAHFDAQAGPEFAVRMVGWGDTLPWTLGAELGFFETHDNRLDLNVTSATVSGGWRARNALLPQTGGLHPYAMAGVSLLIVQGDARLGTMETRIRNGNWYGDSNASPFVAAGVEWDLSRRVGLFAEYRYRSIQVDGASTDNIFFPTSNTLTSATMQASGIAFGISWLPAAGTMAHKPANTPAP